MMPMTEEQWLACKNPDTMLDFAWDHQDKISNRKLRLFAVLCSRQVWDLLDVRSRHAVEIAERYAEGLASPEELQIATNEADNAADDASAKWYEGEDELAANALLSAAEAAACGVGAVSGGVSTSLADLGATSVNRWARLTVEQVVEALTWKAGADLFNDGRFGPHGNLFANFFGTSSATHSGNTRERGPSRWCNSLKRYVLAKTARLLSMTHCWRPGKLRWPSIS
jgi:hypothetical protein